MSGAPAEHAIARATGLVGLFVQPPAACGSFSTVSAGDVPEPFRSLLDHDSHMTVVMERHHHGPVGLRIVAELAGPGDAYAREIVLTGPGGHTVQFGIVRLDLAAVAAETAARIRAADAPLGRVLLDARTMCTVGDVALLRVDPGPHLQRLIGPGPTFGRVATIAVGGRPAVELLEIVATG